MSRLNSRRLSLVAAALMIACLPLVGCDSTPLRTIDPINAEQQSLNSTKPYAASYVREYPAEKGEVDDFYAAWQSRLDKEKAAVAKP